jgi:alpha-tubulin suppressor-like RCC1 family protein
MDDHLQRDYLLELQRPVKLRTLQDTMRKLLTVFLMAATLALSATFITGSRIATRAAGAAGPPGSAWNWGWNAFGQLGNGTATNSANPLAVNLGNYITAVAGGESHSLALNSTGQVLAWGDNSSGQLGNGTTANSSTPVTVNLPSGTIVTAIAAGEGQSLALTSAGQKLAWGSNIYGQLGNGTVTSGSSTPVVVLQPRATVFTAIAAGAYHNLALTSAGRVWAWGMNNFGQLGNATITDSSVPVAVGIPSGTTVTAIAAGAYHSLALTSTGSVLAWGTGLDGQLGNGTTTTINSTPLWVSLPTGTTVTALAGGPMSRSSLALTSTGQMLAWGYNINGQLGNGTTVNSTTPVAVSLPASTTVTAIAGGDNFSLALTSTGKELAWGNNGYGQLGNGTTTNSSTPVFVNAPPVTLAIAAGGGHSMAVQRPAVAVFPAMTNAAYGGYVTAATIQNIGTSPANVSIAYFNQNGALVGTGDVNGSLPVNASWTVRQDNGNSFPNSGGDALQAGSAMVYSTQPIASFVNEFAPGNVGDATSYTGVQVPSGVATTLYAPTIVNNAYGGYTTGIGLLNQGGGPTDVTITYRNGSGTVVKTQTVTALAGHAYKGLYSGDATLALPIGFAGSATITSTSQPLGAIVNETGPGGQLSSYDAVTTGSTTLYVPVALNNAYGGYYTGMAIQNTTATTDSAVIYYYDASGTSTVKTVTVPAYGSVGVYQGSATDGPPPGAYTAVIQGALLLVAIVNEVAPSSTSAKQSTSFNTFSSGSSTVHLPLVENAGPDPWNTGLGIINTGFAPAAVTVTYYDAATGTPIGTPQTVTVGARSYWGLYQPTGGLPYGSRATAVVTVSGGVAVVCNESSPTTFMSYNGQ